MTREVVTIPPAATLAEALAVVREHGIRHIPVVDAERLVGLVTDRDLRLATPPPLTVSEAERRHVLEHTRIADLMNGDVVTAAPELPVEAAARLFYERRIGALPIVDGDRLLGIVTASDLLRALVELFGTGAASTRIEIRMPNRPGELARVVRLIGIDFKLNITGMIIPPQEDDFARAVVRLQTVDPREIIEALTKLGYEVGWPTLK